VGPQPSTLRDCGSILNSEEDDFSRGGDSTDLAGSGEAVHDRHVDVEQNDVRFQLNDFVDGLLAILGIATDLKGMPIQKRTNGRPRSKMVIDDEDSSWQIKPRLHRPAAEGWGSVAGTLWSVSGLVCTIGERLYAQKPSADVCSTEISDGRINCAARSDCLAFQRENPADR
jgi:hypothetical protein